MVKKTFGEQVRDARLVVANSEFKVEVYDLNFNLIKSI